MRCERPAVLQPKVAAILQLAVHATADAEAALLTTPKSAPAVVACANMIALAAMAGFGLCGVASQAVPLRRPETRCYQDKLHA